jgi:hypothetical protein
MTSLQEPHRARSSRFPLLHLDDGGLTLVVDHKHDSLGQSGRAGIPGVVDLFGQLIDNLNLDLEGLPSGQTRDRAKHCAPDSGWFGRPLQPELPSALPPRTYSDKAQALI